MSTPEQMKIKEEDNPKLAISSKDSKPKIEERQQRQLQNNPLNNNHSANGLHFTRSFKKMPKLSTNQESTASLYDDEKEKKLSLLREEQAKKTVNTSVSDKEFELILPFLSKDSVELSLNTNWEENSPTLKQMVEKWKKMGTTAASNSPFDYSFFSEIKYLSIVDALPSHSFPPPPEKKEEFAAACSMLKAMKFPKLESIVIHDFIPSQENLANLLSLIKNNEKTLKKITILNGFTEEELHIIQQELEQYPHIHLKITYRPIMSPETLKKKFDFFNSSQEKSIKLQESRTTHPDISDNNNFQPQ